MKKLQRGSLHGGFSLIEVAVAIGIVAFCVLSLLGLLSVGLKTDSSSSAETAVTNILTSLVSDLGATPVSTPPTSQTSPQFKIPMPASGTQTSTLFFKDDGTLSGTVNSDAVASEKPFYRATVVVMAPVSTSKKGATIVRVLLTWPALADATASSLPSKQQGAVETVTAFLRN